MLVFREHSRSTGHRCEGPLKFTGCYREIKLKMGFGVFIVVITINIPATHRYGRPQITTGHRD